MAVKKLTMVAQQAVGFAELFKAVFADGLQGPVNYRVELSQPDGPSTAGGKLAMQHIKLVPPDSGPTLLIGSANTVEKTADLRSFRMLAGQHAQRFKGATLPIDPQRYASLVESLRTFFSDRGMRVTVQDDVGSAPPLSVAPPAPRSPALLISVLVVLVVIALGGAWLALRPH